MLITRYIINSKAFLIRKSQQIQTKVQRFSTPRPMEIALKNARFSRIYDFNTRIIRTLTYNLINTDELY